MQPAAPALAFPLRPLLGVVLVVAGFQVLSVMDGVAKYLSQDYGVAQIAWGRFFFHVCAIAPVVLWRYGYRALWPRQPRLQLARSCLQLAATVFFFGAIGFIPIVDAVAMVFISPLVVTLLSPWVLGETVGPRRIAAVLVGLGGVLLVLRPGGEVFHWASLLALGAGISFGGFLLLTRKISGNAPVAVTLTFTGLVGAIATSVALPFVWQPMSLAAFALLVSLGVLAAVGHLAIIRAYECAPAALLAPYGYSEIVMATLIGYLAFGDFPDALAWAGIAVIVGSGIYIWFREQRRAGPWAEA